MGLYEEWRSLIEGQTEDTFEAFWKEYSDAETRIYSDLLDSPETTVTGTIKDLSEKYQVRPVIFMGFLDGIDTSLKESNHFEGLKEEDSVTLDFDAEKLYFNMLDAEADYLYTLPQWDHVLTEERRLEIVKDYKRSRTVVKGEKIGRNDPCPCGSGKKYKKCCGR